jgi:hypothetical protein
MAATGFTPISLYYTTTASAAPTAGNLVAGELAINTNDGVLYYKDSSGVVQSIASKAGNSGSFTNLAYTGTFTGGTGVVNLGSGQFYKDASGNVGIGTTGPSQLLDIVGTTPIINIQGGATTNARGLQFKYGASTITGSLTNFGGTGETALSGGASGSSGYFLTFKTDGSERMRIAETGNVGIGTSSPSQKLQVNDAGNVTFQLTKTGVASFTLTNNGTSGTVLNVESVPMIFNTANTERMRITSAGKLLVGATSSLTNNETSQFNSVGASAVAINATTGVNLLNWYYNGTLVSAVSTNGTTITYGVGSDYRLKENIKPLTNGLDKVLQLRPSTWDWQESFGQGSSQGFVAHELQEVIPEAVAGEKDAVNEDGSIKAQQVDTSFLVATLTAAIQEQQVLITQLQADVAALKAK